MGAVTRYLGLDLDASAAKESENDVELHQLGMEKKTGEWGVWGKSFGVTIKITCYSVRTWALGSYTV